MVGQKSQKSGMNALLRFATLLLVTTLTFFTLRWSFGFMQNDDAPKSLVAVVALVVGVCGVWIIYWVLNDWVSYIPFRRLREAILPFVFLGPALTLLFVYLVYPAVNTIYISFLDKKSKAL